MEHSFTPVIKSVLQKYYKEQADEILKKSADTIYQSEDEVCQSWFQITGEFCQSLCDIRYRRRLYQ